MGTLARWRDQSPRSSAGLVTLRNDWNSKQNQETLNTSPHVKGCGEHVLYPESRVCEIIILMIIINHLRQPFAQTRNNTLWNKHYRHSSCVNSDISQKSQGPTSWHPNEFFHRAEPFPKYRYWTFPDALFLIPDGSVPFFTSSPEYSNSVFLPFSVSSWAIIALDIQRLLLDEVSK